MVSQPQLKRPEFKDLAVKRRKSRRRAIKGLRPKKRGWHPRRYAVAAKGLLLHATGNHSPQQVLAQTRRRRSSEHRPPAPPKGIKRKHRVICSARGWTRSST